MQVQNQQHVDTEKCAREGTDGMMLRPRYKTQGGGWGRPASAFVGPPCCCALTFFLLTRALLMTSSRSKAYHSKRLLLILDGLDEAPHLKGLIKSFVLTSLVAGSHRVLLTSRKEGVDADLEGFGFTVLSLKAYSEAQQKKVLTNQSTEYGRDFMEHLLEFSTGLRMMDALVEKPTDETDSNYKTALEDWDAVDVIDDNITCGCNEHRHDYKIKKEFCKGDHTVCDIIGQPLLPRIPARALIDAAYAWSSMFSLTRAHLI